jgi:competence protein ComEC
MTLVWLAICWTVGILLGRALEAPLWLCAALAMATALGLAAAWPAPRWRLALACALFMALGTTRMAVAAAHGQAETLQRLNEQGRVTVSGWVCAEPSVRARAVQLEVCATSVDAGAGDQAVRGKLLTTVPRYAGVRYGQPLALTGRLETPPSSSDFDYREYLQAQGVRSLLRYPEWQLLPGQAGSPLLRAAYAAKERLRLATERSLPDPEAGLLNGILLGLGHTLPEELYDGYRRVGLTHIIVISGFNLSLVVQLVLALAGRVFHRWRALWISLAAVSLYALFVGATPPVVRAAIMAGLCLLAQRLGRRAHLLTAVAVASLLMSAANPLVLWGASFQLSFASTLALALLEPRLAAAAEVGLAGASARPWLPLLRELLLASLAAQLATLPIIWATFDEVSLISLLSNILVLPSQGGIMLLGWPVPLLGLVHPLLGRMAGLPAWALLRWTNLVVEWLARLPWAAISVPPVPGPVIWAFYGGLMTAALRPRRPIQSLDNDDPHKVHDQSHWRYALPALAALVALLWTALPDGKLHVYALDVGQGDALLLRTPRGRTVLVDGGPDPLLLTARLGRVLPFWQRRLHLVVSTHADSDHLGGLIPVAQRYRVGAALESPCMPASDLTAAWHAGLSAQGVTPLPGVAGVQVELEPGLTLTLLQPDADAACAAASSNDKSVVALVTYGDCRILLTGDASAEVERRLVAAFELDDLTVLKVGHHGAAASTGEALLAESRPRVALVSVGRDNSYGHPAAEVLERLAVYGAQVLRTDEQGTVEFITDGARYWIRTRATLASEGGAHE